MTEKHIVGSESKEIFYEESGGICAGEDPRALAGFVGTGSDRMAGTGEKRAQSQSVRAAGYRNGYGRPSRLAMSLGTIEIHRPRVRDLGERFKSQDCCRCLSGKAKKCGI